MDIAIKNTLNEIEMEIKVQRRAVKDIAIDCAFCVNQTDDIDAKNLFAALSKCKTRKQMSILLGNFLGES